MSVHLIIAGRHYFTSEGELCVVQGQAQGYESSEDLVIIERLVPRQFKESQPHPVVVSRKVFEATFDEVQGGTKRCTVFNGSEQQLLELIDRLPDCHNPDVSELVVILSHPDNRACDSKQYSAINTSDIESHAKARGYAVTVITRAALSTGSTEEALRSTVRHFSDASYGPRAYAHIFIEKQKYDQV